MDAQLQKSLELLKNAQSLAKDATTQGITTQTGLTYYDLEAGAKLLYPVLTPLRNRIPRAGKTAGARGFGDAAHWKAITAINPTNVSPGVSEGNRGAVISVTEKDYTAPYKGIGLEEFVNFEAEYGSEGFDDARAKAALTLLQSVMISEEQLILHGNASYPLGTTPTPTLTVGTGGAVTVGTNNAVACVALTYDGYNRASLANGVVTSFTKTNADGSTDTVAGGAARISALSATIATTSGNQKITAKVAAVKDAYAYAWYFTEANSLASAYLYAITTVNQVVIDSDPVNTNQAANAAGLSTDNSANSLVFDGLIPQALNGGGYFKSLDGATLTADGEGGVVEIDTALKYFWDTFRLSPTAILVGSQAQKDISSKVLSGSTNPVYRIQLESGNGQRAVTAGALVTSYLNKYGLGGAREIPVELHPWMPDGTVLFDLDEVPYPNSNVPAARRMKMRRDYYQIEWPLRSRKYEHGVYFDGLLQCYVPFGMGVLSNVAAG